jgi:hypothetical protein
MKSAFPTLCLLTAFAACGDTKDTRPTEDVDPSQESDSGVEGDGDAEEPDASVEDGDAGAPEADSGTGKPTDDAGADADAALAAELRAKFEQCKVDPPGADAQTKIEDETARCSARCIVAASCDDVRGLACTSSPSTNALLTCLRQCPMHPADGYGCSDGTKIPHAALCDGFANCTDQGDEAACGEYVCADGTKVSSERAKCDGDADCPDASDEAGCPAICR